VTPHDVEVWAAWFEDFFATLASLFRPVEPRQTARSYLKALLGTVERKNTRQISAYTSRSNSEETAMAARKTAAPRPAKTPAAPAEPPKCGPRKGTGQVAVPVMVGRSHRQVGQQEGTCLACWGTGEAPES
jgi:hypothetical protein